MLRKRIVHFRILPAAYFDLCFKYMGFAQDAGLFA